MAAPKIIPYNVELRSVNPVRSFDRPKAYTNDLNSVEFQFKILDMTSTELSTATAVTLVYMRDGSFFANPSTDVSRVGNVFSYLLKENEGNHAGVAQIQLVVTVDGMELASQLFDFEIINGLETKVAQEVMIYDWTTLTRDAQDYIDQFVSNETTRQQQFSDAQMQRGTTFGDSEAGRTTIFNASEAGRTTTFNESEAGRTTAFNAAEEARATGYDADHSRAGTDHTTAVNDHTLAGTDHTTAANDHTLAGTDHTRAESDHTRADADSATVAGFNTRLTAEETATANNKISAVKGKTFADVDARFEDVETDTVTMGTNRVLNGDFKDTGSWQKPGVSLMGQIYQTAVGSLNETYYVSASVKVQTAGVIKLLFSTFQLKLFNTAGQFEKVSAVVKATASTNMVIADTRSSSWDSFDVKEAIVINLTATFGAGKEPTVEQMDEIMSKFTNSWFDGTKNLFRANATLNKLMAIDARTEFEAKSLVTNGDMSNGTYAWGLSGCTATVVGGEVEVVATGTTASVALPQKTQARRNGQKMYVRFTGRVISSGALSISCSIGTGAATVTNPLAGQIYTQSTIATMLSDNVDIYVIPTHTYVDAATANGKVAYFDNIFALDLTATFGAGKEPTLAEMDRLMARFPNSWFDGVKPIQTIETLYQEKASKVQEAWLTPTLVNSWTEMSAIYPVRYRKDSLGKVTLKGRITSGVTSTTVFTLPVGYRPPYTMSLSCATSLNTTVRVLVYDTGAVNVSGTISGDPYLDGITFDTN
jgi:hypothetical protein